MSLQVPFFLPGGQSLLLDHDFIKRLHEGDASVGWLGDDRLGVYWADDRIELWRSEDDGEMRLVMRSRPGVKILDTETLKFLAAHDSRRRGGFDAFAEVDRHNAKVRADAAKALEDRHDAAIDRLHWALLRDIGAYEGGTSRRQMTLPDAPWKAAK